MTSRGHTNLLHCMHVCMYACMYMCVFSCLTVNSINYNSIDTHLIFPRCLFFILHSIFLISFLYFIYFSFFIFQIAKVSGETRKTTNVKIEYLQRTLLSEAKVLNQKLKDLDRGIQSTVEEVVERRSFTSTATRLASETAKKVPIQIF